MAGAAACAMGYSWIIITSGIDVAAQTAAAEHIVGQRERGCQRGAVGYGRWGCQAVLRAKMCPDRVDFFAEGEMQGMGRVGYLPGMAFAAGRRHVCRVAWLDNQTGMGLVDLPFRIEAVMTGNAGQGVGRIELDFAMTPCATGYSGWGRYWLGGGSFWRFWNISFLATATAQQQENNE